MWTLMLIEGKEVKEGKKEKGKSEWKKENYDKE